MREVHIASTGLWIPEHKVSNDELIQSFNEYVDKYNEDNKDSINEGFIKALEHSSTEFVEKASGIKSRYVIEKKHLLDPNFMKPLIEPRDKNDLSILAEIGVNAAKDALDRANLQPKDIDAVIVSAANISRAYPAIAIEIQNELDIKGYAYDMMVACSSATFGISNAYSDIKTEKADTILVINPEITTAHNNYTDREAHFIFGDVAAATIVQGESNSPVKSRIISFKQSTVFSNNIRNEKGFINFIENKDYTRDELLFKQNGKKVFKDVCPLVAELISEHLSEEDLSHRDIKKFWLHQANLNMNNFILKRIVGDDEFNADKAPCVLDEFANTSSAGSLIAYHRHNDLKPGDKGIICSFGGGYSICSILVEK